MPVITTLVPTVAGSNNRMVPSANMLTSNDSFNVFVNTTSELSGIAWNNIESITVVIAPYVVTDAETVLEKLILLTEASVTV